MGKKNKAKKQIEIITYENSISYANVTKVKGLKNKIKWILYYIKRYYKTPPPKRYLSIKEIIAFCLGAIGIAGVLAIPTYTVADVGAYIGAALDIQSKYITLIGIIAAVVGLIRAPIIAALIDNSKEKKGKFQRHIKWQPVIIFLSVLALGWIPQIFMGRNTIAVLVLYIVFVNILASSLSVYMLSFESIKQVISPSPQERTMIMSLGSFVYSMGPTIVNFAFPVISAAAFTAKLGGGVSIMGYNRIGAYKYILPAITLIFLMLGYFIVIGTKERIVLSKQTKIKVSFKKGIKQTFTNKYFLILTISNTIGVFKAIGCVVVILWSSSYILKSGTATGILATLAGTACVPGMVLAPIAIKKFGKKKLHLFTGIVSSILTILLALPLINPNLLTTFPKSRAVIMLIIFYIYTLIYSFQIVTLPALIAQSYDFEQYKSGDRIEGFMSQAMGVAVILAGFLVLLFKSVIFTRYGAHRNYNESLVNALSLGPILTWFLVVGGIAGLLSMAPFFLWDISERRHDKIMDILKIRAASGNGDIDETLALDLEQRLENDEDIEGLEEIINKFESEITKEGTKVNV